MTKQLLITLIAAVSTCRATTYYLGTDQSGAQTQIDISHMSTWTFTPNVDFGFGGGVFNMKAGSSAIDNVSLSLYQGTDATGSLLGTVTLTNTAFCAQVGSCSSYDVHDFFYSSPIALSNGTTYFAALTSVAPNSQSQAYFIKSGAFFMGDQSGTAAVPHPIGGVAPVPEPVTLALMGFGLTCLGLVRRYRRPSSREV
jgi:hypothetical protein